MRLATRYRLPVVASTGVALAVLLAACGEPEDPQQQGSVPQTEQSTAMTGEDTGEATRQNQ